MLNDIHSIDTLIVNGGCELQKYSFSAESFIAAIGGKPTIKCVIFRGNKPTKVYESTFNGQSKIHSVYVADEDAAYPKALNAAVSASAVDGKMQTPTISVPAGNDLLKNENS